MDGFYAGVHAGYGWGSNDSNTITLPDPATFLEQPFSMDISSRGALAGIQAGYNQQIDRVVLGVEGDFAYTGIKGEETVSPLHGFFGAPAPGTFQTNSQKMDWFGTLRARAGLLASDRLLLFATGGLAFGHVEYSGFQFLTATLGNQFAGEASKWKSGWTVGGGAEWAISGRWNVKADYLYYDLGSKTVTQNRVPFIAGVDEFKVVSDFETRGHLARVGVNYRF